jgi:hypothetical protein
MNTNFRALCIELVEALENARRIIHREDGTLHINTAEFVLRRARAALAEPPPADEKVAIPCNADMAAAMVLLGESFLRQYAPERLVPQPVPEGPTDEALDELAWNWFSKTGSTWWQIEGFRAFARAVLARWGRP